MRAGDNRQYWSGLRAMKNRDRNAESRIDAGGYFNCANCLLAACGRCRAYSEGRAVLGGSQAE
jgi:hypothetical protein